jgi:hypothetical protein
MAKRRIMKNLLIALIFLLINCIPKSFAVSEEEETVKVHFKEIEGRYAQLVDKTQFYVFRDSKGAVVPVEDSLEAEYYIQFAINSSLMRLKNPEDKIYEVVVKVKPKENSSLVGMTEAKDEGKWDEVVTHLSKELADNLVSIFKRILKEKYKEETPEPEEETEKEIKNE